MHDHDVPDGDLERGKSSEEAQFFCTGGCFPTPLAGPANAAAGVDQRQRAQQRLETSLDVLDLFARCHTRKEFFDSLLALIRSRSRCEFIGIRLIDGRRHIPYEITCGFDKAFIDQEQDLSLDRDQCICTRMMAGIPDPHESQWITAGGSFVTNDSSAMAASLTPERLERYRGTCLKHGFRSVAILPIRCGTQTISILHLADPQPHAFSKELIDFIEGIAPLIGQTMQRFAVEQRLRESQALFSAVFHQTMQFVTLLNLDGTVREANETYMALFQNDPRTPWRGVPFWELPAWDACSDKTWLHEAVAQACQGRTTRKQVEVVDADGTAGYIDFSLKPVISDDGQILCLMAEGRDITESRRLERHVLDLTSQEQHQVGSDLHEVLGQDLAGITMLSTVLKQRLNSKGLPEAEDASRIAELAKRAVGEARSLAMDLCVAGHKKDDLATALQLLAMAIEQEHGIACLIEEADVIYVSNPTITAQLFRIVQEAARMAVRYGNASCIRISLESQTDGFGLTIQDNGDRWANTPNDSQRMGIEIMKYRAAMIGGTLDIQAHRSGRTVVHVSVE